MTRVRLVLAASAVLAAAAAARAGEPDVRFPAGACVRAGRPLVVRVPGARRVRAPGAPWALPQGAAADEFVLQAPRADLTFRELEVETDAGTSRVPLRLRVLPAEGPVVAAFPGSAAGAASVELVPGDLPTVPEAWLVYDDVAAAPDALATPVRRALDAWRLGPRAGRAAAFQPLLHEPGPAAFRATAEAAAATGALPGDVVRALVLAACAEVLLLALLRSAPGARRAAWLAVPPAACALWLLGSGRLPGGVRATVTEWTDDSSGARVVVVRFDARRAGEVSFRVPEGASTPALLRFDADDRAAESASIGREVRLPIPAGQSRVLAWRAPPRDDAAPAEGAPVRPAVAAWLAALGAGEATARPVADPSDDLLDPEGFVPVAAGSVAVTTRK